MPQTLDNLTYTWNNSGTTFTGIKYNVTDTASASGSLLMDLQVNGGSKLTIDKSGVATFSAGVAAGRLTITPTTANDVTISAGRNLNIYAEQSTYTLTLRGASINLVSSPSSFTSTFVSEANHVLAQRNGVNAQTKRLYGTYTDSSNYRRLTQTMSTGGVAEIKPEGAGTGASGNVLHISGLPTSNPGAGILWNDAGTVKVGT